MDTSTPNTPEIHRVPDHRFVELEKRVERFARRSAKHGLKSLSIEVIGEEIVDEVYRDETTGVVKKTGRKLVFKLVVVHGEAPVVEGHTFIARLEHTGAGNIISKAPGVTDVEVPKTLRDRKSICDHCSTNRRRNDTFIVRDDESGDMKQIGRNCLADFIRSSDATEAVKIWNLLAEIQRAAFREGDDMCGLGGSGHSYYGLEHYLTHVSRSIELNGWTSRGQAYGSDVTSTSEDALFGMEPLTRYDDKSAWEKAQPLDHNVTEATETLEWVKTLKGDNDYENNLKVSCGLGIVKPKNMGLVASAVSVLRRNKERELYKAREAKRTENSVHFGTIGSRYLRKLTVIKTKTLEGHYGTTFLYTMDDESGNSFKWFSSNGVWMKFEGSEDERGLDVGDNLFFVFAVKGHGEWNGALETTISRAKASLETPTIKWLNEATGEIFKTRKEMAAA